VSRKTQESSDDRNHEFLQDTFDVMTSSEAIPQSCSVHFRGKEFGRSWRDTTPGVLAIDSECCITWIVEEWVVRRPSLLFPAIAVTLCACSTVRALTQEEIKTKTEAAGYSQIREMPSGKIRTFKAVKNGKERSIIVDSNGHIKELP
jgi:hypothetical protein